MIAQIVSMTKGVGLTYIVSQTYIGNNVNTPKQTIRMRKLAECILGRLFNNTVYNAQHTVAPNIHKSPLLNLRLERFAVSPLNIITSVPNEARKKPKP